jgi:hypothetical protein
MSKYVKEKNKRLRESADWVPPEIYKATRPKARKVFPAKFIHVAAEPVREQVWSGETRIQTEAPVIRTKGVTPLNCHKSNSNPPSGFDHEPGETI